MKPEVWGPHAWIFLHSVTMDYPDNPTSQDKKEMKDFFNALKYILPCHKCSKNFKKNIKKHPLTDDILSSKEDLINWLISIHNMVNKENGKSTMSHKEAIKKLEKMYD